MTDDPTDDRFREAAVVVFPEALEDAYREGYKRFATTAGETVEQPGEALSGFKEYAEWANHVAPSLRASAGYADTGHGTYTYERQVALVDYPDDRPMEATLVSSEWVFRQLVDAFDRGAYDSMDSKELDASEIIAEKV